MTHAEFLELVALMRAAQRRWFDPTTRTQEVLQESRGLERQVDRAIEELKASAGGKQGRLFP